jgi:hypothetical protein
MKMITGSMMGVALLASLMIPSVAWLRVPATRLR